MRGTDTYLKDYTHYTGGTLWSELMEEWKEAKRILEEQGEVKIYYLDEYKKKEVTA